MEKRYITVNSAKESLAVYEERFGMSTEEFYALHLANDPRVHEIPKRVRSGWAGVYRTLLRMTGEDELPKRVKRELEYA